MGLLIISSFSEYHNTIVLLEGIEGWWEKLAWNFKDTWKKVLEELIKSKDAAHILARAASGEEIDSSEKEFVREQVKDIMRGIVFGSAVAVPGSIVLIPLLLWVSRRMGVEIVPSSFRKNKKLDEAKKPKKADRCKRKADQVYGKKTSAYKSGAIVRCRKGKIWKKK